MGLKEYFCLILTIIFMSKYKYTSLLSSEYRSVFKSYHSIDRNER